MVDNYDFAGWVTKNDIRCSDGVTIRHDAFASNNGGKVPLVWQHDYKSVSNVLGSIVLQNAKDGVYGYGYFNSTPAAQDARELVKHGDLNSMSIGARGIQKQGNNVIHGSIYEVSLVLAGANPGAKIEYNMMHSAYGDEEDDTATIFGTGTLLHTRDELPDPDGPEEIIEHAQGKDAKMADVQTTDNSLEIGGQTFTKAQYDIIENLVAGIINEYEDDDDDDDDEDEPDEDEEVQQSLYYEGEDILKQNAFDAQYGSQVPEFEDEFSKKDVNTILQTAISSRVTSLNAVFMANGLAAEVDDKGDALTQGLTLKHGLAMEFTQEEDGTVLQHAVDNVEVLFPTTSIVKGLQVYDPDSLNIETMLAAFSKSPMSRVKNLFADLTEEDARAKGYIKGNEKLESIEAMYFRETTPQTVIRKTKFDRDDMTDISENGIDILGYIQQVQQSKLKQELVRAALLGDGRPATITVDGSTVKNPDKIDPAHIRPIFTDDGLFTIHAPAIPDWATFPDALAMLLPFYQGSGSPILYLNPLDIAKIRTLKDTNGRRLFLGYNGGNALPSLDVVAADLGVGGIMEYRKMPVGQFILGNLGDYVFGASKGGQVANFDFFDIDFNVQKFLIETRVSGAIQTPKAFVVGTITDPGSADLSALAFTKTGVSGTPSWVAGGDVVAAGKDAGGTGTTEGGVVAPL